MRRETVKTGGGRQRGRTRREILCAAAAAAVGFFARPGRTRGQSTQPASRPAPPASRPVSPASRPGPLAPGDRPWWMGEGPRSRVVDIRSRDVLQDSMVEPAVAGQMLDQGIVNFARAKSVAEAWRAILGSAERILLKFNSVGAEVLNTNNALAGVIVARLAEAGYDQRKITLVEVSDYLTPMLETRLASKGWGEAIRVGDSSEQLAQYLYDADAIINVPQLKTHTIAGMSCSMKNLSHALIRHPGRYHANGCSPYVGQVIAAPAVHSRLRLNLVNAVRVVIDRGPDAREEDIVPYGGLLLGYDPVAVDNVGRSILALERRRRGLDPWFRVPHLDSAAEMGLGRWRPADINRVALECIA